MKLVILRPTDGALQSAAIAHNLGFDPLIASASEICPLDWEAPDPREFDAIMITSANALRGGDAVLQYRILPMFAVGKATAKLATEMGFTIAAIGQGGAKALWPLIVSHGAKNILRLVGRDYVAVETDLNVRTIISYEARALPIADNLKALMSDSAAPHIFTFHSAKAVQIFDDYIAEMRMQGINFDKSNHYAAALAPTIAQKINSQSTGKWRKTIISPSANDAAMMAALSEMLGG